MAAECCGNCKYHKYGFDDDDSWYCDNDNSDYYACETEYSDSCEDFEEK